MKHIIVGGVAGGATAAARIRRIDEQAEILLIEKGKYISYANCGLPYYIGGVIAEREKLFVQTPESFGNRFRIDVRVENEVVAIDPKNKKVILRQANGGETEETYDKLLLSPGASPVRPPLEGIDSEGIFTLRNVTDTDRIKHFIQSRPIKKAVIVGAGFIGLEMAENLHHIGAEVSIVEMGNQVMAPIDFSMASLVHEHLQAKGIHLYLEQSVERFEQKANILNVFFKGGKKIEADIVILSIGVRPETTLAKQAGLRIGETGGIWVDSCLQTSEPNIYAVGDAIEYPHPLTGKPWLNYLANPANRQGRIVADNMVWGNNHTYEGAIGTSIAKVFDLTVAATGLPAKRLKTFQMDYLSSTTHSGSNAGYYPTAMPMSIKLTFHPQSGKLYGAQVVGYTGVDKRIDQLALLIKQGGSIYDLMELEHAYAPPYSSAKDPIAIAGYVASNVLSGKMPVLYWREFQQALADHAVIIDVRTADEHAMDPLVGSINIPLDEIRKRMNEIPTDCPIYLFCAIGLRGYLAMKVLQGCGYTQVKNLSGGSKLFRAATTPIHSASTPHQPSPVNTNLDEQNMKATIIQTQRLKVDACGLQCPGPILKVKQNMEKMREGEQIEVISTDAGFARDVQAWCNSTGNQLISKTSESGRHTVILEKGEPKACSLVSSCENTGKSFIMFSDDLDKALATFVLANGAAATGGKVTIFFTFWGLNVLKKKQKPAVKKDFFGKMFSLMLPSHSLQLKLSKMNMLGIGSKMMRHLMAQKGVDSLESLRQQALDQGVEFIACQMSMDVMGVKREELMDEVSIGGVATYMERAEKSSVNLFI